jgi:exopolyphosphatase/guanosine-5'-triphosphate,3'-diphosphate pyrophosphatase
LRTLASARMLDRAHVLGATLRVAYVVTAAMPGILPRTPLTVVKDKLVLSIPPDLADVANERVNGRMKQLSKLIGRDYAIKVK